jgi:ABC-type transport system involved in multi-copper enzyme maturation permease subunit
MFKDEIITMFIRRHIKLAILVSLLSFLLTLSLVTLFPAMNIDNALVISESWPEIMKDMFGDPLHAFSDPYAWLYLQVFHITYWAILGIFAIILASSVFLKEIEYKTMDVLLTTPLSRKELLFKRLLGIIILLSLPTLTVSLGCIIGIMILGYPIYLHLIFSTTIIGFLLAINFAVITLLISLFKSSSTVVLYSSFAIIGFMFMFEELLVKVVPVLKNISFLSLFHYYKPDNILIYDSFSYINPGVLLILFLILSYISSMIFASKDIKL